MGYRKIEKPKPIRRVLQDMTTKNMTYVQNGATAYLAVPCWYMEVRHPQHTHLHDREWHDHIGWPSPTRPDHSSQAAYALKNTPYMYERTTEYNDEGWVHPDRYIDMSMMHPIHLAKEGYTDVEVAFVNPPEGLSAYGHIDDRDDWVVRFMLNPMCSEAFEKDLEVSYTVFVKGNISGMKRRDVIARGTLKILAGPIAE